MLPWSSLEELTKLKNKVAPNMLERAGWQKAISNFDQANSNTGVSMVRPGPLCSRMIFADVRQSVVMMIDASMGA